MRIVSLLPSATEILFAVGAGEQVVGVTFECDFPAEARSRRVVSNTALPPGLSVAEIDAEVRKRMAAGDDIYRLDRDALADIGADLVVTQDLCAVCAVDVSTLDDALAHLGCRAEVLTLDPMTLDEVLDSIETVGKVVDAGDRATAIMSGLRERLTAVQTATANTPRPRMAVLEWPDPPFSSGHWVPDMVTAAGAEPVLGKAGERSVAVTWDAVAESRPDVIVLAPCGYRLPAAVDLATDLLAREVLPPGIPLWAADADASFVRPGPRLVDGVEALAGVAHPDRATARPDVITLVEG